MSDLNDLHVDDEMPRWAFPDAFLSAVRPARLDAPCKRSEA